MHAVSGMRSAVIFAFGLVPALVPAPAPLLAAPVFPVFPAALVWLALAMGACAAGAPPPPMPPPEYEDGVTTPSTPWTVPGLGLGADADANAAKPGLTHGDLR
jgi:hypothetical protein